MILLNLKVLYFTYFPSYLPVVMILILLHNCLYFTVKSCGLLYCTNVKKKKNVLALKNSCSSIFSHSNPQLHCWPHPLTPALALSWRDRWGPSHTWHLKGLFSCTLHKAHPAPGTPVSRLCPSSCPKVEEDKLFCLDEQPQRWYTDFVLPCLASSMHLNLSPDVSEELLAFREWRSFHLLESSDFWRYSDLLDGIWCLRLT